MFEDNILLQKMHWDYLLSNKLKFDHWKGLDHNSIKMHVSKAKDEMLDKLEKETCTVKLMMDECLGSYNTVTLEEVSQLHFGCNGVVCKHCLKKCSIFIKL